MNPDRRTSTRSFYFHLRTQAGLEKDEIGVDLPDLEAAYLVACEAIPTLMVDLMSEGHEPLRCTFELTDATGQLLMLVPFSELLETARKPRKPTEGPRLDKLDRLTASVQHEAARLNENLRQARAYVAQIRTINR